MALFHKLLFLKCSKTSLNCFVLLLLPLICLLIYYRQWSPHHHKILSDQCKPNSYVGFLKTHKTGSSTVQNILARYAFTHNQPVVTPRDGVHLCYWKPFTSRQDCMMNPEKPHTMLINHVVYSKLVRNLLPSDSVWFTILRNPVDVYDSIYDYYQLDVVTKVGFDEFIMNPEKYLPLFQKTESVYRRICSQFLLEHDLGFDWEQDIATKTIIDFMEAEFDVVLIAEYFDEGLCFLRKKLCWQFEDILYFRQNERSHKSKFSDQTKQVYYEQLKKVMPRYIEVYEYFSTKFVKRINSELKEDVSLFREKLEIITKQCQGDDGSNVNETGKLTGLNKKFVHQFQPVKIKTIPVKNNSEICHMLAYPESTILKMLKRQAYQRAKNN